MPASPATSNKPSAAARYLFLFLIGLVIGIVATVMAMRAIDARSDPYPGAVMHVMDAHMAALGDNLKQNRCSATDTLPQLQSLRTVANDIEPAFGDLREDQRFAKHASDLRAALDDALASPPLGCPSLKSAVGKVGAACKACHQDFRS